VFSGLLLTRCVDSSHRGLTEAYCAPTPLTSFVHDSRLPIPTPIPIPVPISAPTNKPTTTITTTTAAAAAAAAAGVLAKTPGVGGIVGAGIGTSMGVTMGGTLPTAASTMPGVIPSGNGSSSSSVGEGSTAPNSSIADSATKSIGISLTTAAGTVRPPSVIPGANSGAANAGSSASASANAGGVVSLHRALGIDRERERERGREALVSPTIASSQSAGHFFVGERPTTSHTVVSQLSGMESGRSFLEIASLETTGQGDSSSKAAAAATLAATTINVSYLIREFLETDAGQYYFRHFCMLADAQSRDHSRLLKLLTDACFDNCVALHSNGGSSSSSSSNRGNSEKLGSGAFGSVYKVVCPASCSLSWSKNGRQFAVKKIPRERFVLF